MKNTKKMIRNAILFVLLIILTFTVILKNANLMDIVEAFSNVNVGFIVLAVGAMFLYFVCNKYWKNFKSIGRKKYVLEKYEIFIDWFLF